MSTLILSGMGSSTSNWLPLVAPIAIIVLLVYGTQQGARYIKRKRMEHTQKLAHVDEMGENETAHTEDSI